jgi:threonyl-tRNA synthetase
VIPISEDVQPAAAQVARRLKDAGLRAKLDDRSETLNYRVRDAEVMKVPYMAVIGKREAEAGTIAVRVRGAGKKQEIMAVGDFVERLQWEVATRALAPVSQAGAAAAD